MRESMKTDFRGCRETEGGIQRTDNEGIHRDNKHGGRGRLFHMHYIFFSSVSKSWRAWGEERQYVCVVLRRMDFWRRGDEEWEQMKWICVFVYVPRRCVSYSVVMCSVWWATCLDYDGVCSHEVRVCCTITASLQVLSICLCFRVYEGFPSRGHCSPFNLHVLSLCK